MRIYEVYEDREGKFHFFVLEDGLTTPKCVAAFCGLEMTPEHEIDLLAALGACWKDGDAWQSWDGAEHPPPLRRPINPCRARARSSRGSARRR